MRALPLCSLALLASARATAQAPADAYPVKPVPLADSAEIALAMSAAPAELSAQAVIYTVKDGQVITLRRGTNGSACMVARDSHAGSLYPICYNPEGARTVLKRELMQVRLRSLGVAEDSIDRSVESAYKRGELEVPKDVALAYMMSPQQVLFSQATKDGRRVGAWHPHLMLYVPGATPSKFGLSDTGPGEPIQVGSPGTPQAEVIIKVQKWADGKRVGGPGGQ
ncbi:MAG TPA: hypothetical protein VM076_21475 [Gemmatimonadaceae bacterium]|nr:hypothetical protein [Gemmatimonadaceae bacterium]